MKISVDGLVYVCDRINDRVQVFHKVGSFGRSGRQAGQFHWVHSIAIDSHGNVYTGEVDTGKRIQKFRLVSGAPER